MMITYWVTDSGTVAKRVNGDPLTDDFFNPPDLNRWIEKKRKDGAEITYLNPPRVEVWGGPHFGWASEVRVIAVVEVR